MKRYFVPAFPIWISCIQKGIIAQHPGRKFIKENRQNEPCYNAHYGRSARGSFPEHAKNKHCKYTWAYKAGIFLYISKSTHTTNTQQVVPCKEHSKYHGNKYSNPSCHYLLSFVCFFAKIFFINV